jgi:DNA helicase TIP49 (TBP-interacting protein)
VRMAPMSASTHSATARASANFSGGTTRIAAGLVGQPRPRRPAGVARQIRDQRRGYAQAVLRGVARTHQGRPAAQTRKILAQSLSPLGVRLSPTMLHELATDIEAGRPVELP